MTDAQRTEPEAAREPNQCTDRPYGLGTNMDFFGVGGWEDMHKYLVLGLQHNFQTERHRDDGGGDVLAPSGKFALDHSLHGQLLDAFILVAGAIGHCVDKWHLLAGAVSDCYRKYLARFYR